MTAFSNSDLPDIEQELALHVWLQIGMFDPAIACELTFVARVIDHKAVSIVRYRQAQKRNPAREHSSLDDPEPPYGHRAVNGEAYTRTDLASDLLAILDELPEPDRTVAFELGNGTLASAAKKLGLTRAQARTVKDHIRQRFEDHGLDKYL